MKTRVLTRSAALLLLATMIAPAWGDEWPAPQVFNVFSPNGEHFVRLIPGESSGANHATARFYALRKEDQSFRMVAEVALKNAILPAYAKVTDEGYLAAFDDWFSIGRGPAVAFYGPQGKLIRAINISELYSPDELQRLQRSMTMTAWRCGINLTTDDNGEPALHVRGNAGVSFLLYPRSGDFKRITREGGSSCGLESAAILTLPAF